MDNDDDFIFIYPKRGRPSLARARKCVRVSFSRSKRGENVFLIMIYIGKDLAKEMHFEPGDKISVGYNKTNHRKVMVKKAKIGYTLIPIGSERAPSYRLLIPWQPFKPKENEMALREVEYDISDSEDAVFTFVL